LDTDNDLLTCSVNMLGELDYGPFIELLINREEGTKVGLLSPQLTRWCGGVS